MPLRLACDLMAGFILALALAGFLALVLGGFLAFGGVTLGGGVASFLAWALVFSLISALTLSAALFLWPCQPAIYQLLAVCGPDKGLLPVSF